MPLATSGSVTQDYNVKLWALDARLSILHENHWFSSRVYSAFKSCWQMSILAHLGKSFSNPKHWHLFTAKISPDFKGSPNHHISPVDENRAAGAMYWGDPEILSNISPRWNLQRNVANAASAWSASAMENQQFSTSKKTSENTKVGSKLLLLVCV